MMMKAANGEIVLAIETSQRDGGVALRDRQGMVHVDMLSTAKRHDDDLLATIDRLFRRAGLEAKDLAGGIVGVSIGPGGFTGLRIAISTAKMLAQALDVRIAAVPSAVVAAESASDNPGPVLVCLSAKGQSCWATRLVRTNRGEARWRIDGTPGLADADSPRLDEWLEGIRAVIADEHLPQGIAARCDHLGVARVSPVFDPRACLATAVRMAAAGEFTDAQALAPLYPRQPEAVTLWDQKMSRPR